MAMLILQMIATVLCAFVAGFVTENAIAGLCVLMAYLVGFCFCYDGLVVPERLRTKRGRDVPSLNSQRPTWRVHDGYAVLVQPARHEVRIAIQCASHRWLRHLSGIEPMGADVLAVEVRPDEIDSACRALVAEADRLVRAIKAAWEHGWRPEPKKER